MGDDETPTTTWAPSSRSLSFGAVAAAYERFRPGYPDALVDAVLDYAGRPVRTALEIGAGTGKATRAFAARGIEVTATDPDASMLEELRRHVPAHVSTRQAALEDLAPDPVHDLVYAAAALHWTQPGTRWQRVAALLAPHGVFASFGAQLHLADPDLEHQVAEVRSQVMVDDAVPAPDGTPPDSPMLWPGTELDADPAFTDVRQSVLERRLPMSADSYVAHLATISAYLELAEDVRSQVLDQIHAVLPEQVVVNGDLTLHLARLAS